MIDRGKKNVVGVNIDAVDYEAAVGKITTAAKLQRPYAVSALAVHGTMIGAIDPEQRYRLNHFHLLVPDGQPVRWALNLIHGTNLADRVYGPALTLRIFEAAAEQQLPVFLFGSTAETLQRMQQELLRRFPTLQVAGAEPSQFRQLEKRERDELVKRIQVSGARILFVGLGCPRQEVFAFEVSQHLQMPIIAVGAAFPFTAGALPQAPQWMQKRGLEWLFRLSTEPRRLWRRYIYLNPYYIALVALQTLGFSFSNAGVAPARESMYG